MHALHNRMSDTQLMGTEQSTLGLILSTGIQVVKLVVPNWQPPNLDHPYAKSYDSAILMMENIEVGDQIMVKANDGYWHHGIYVGMREMPDNKGRNKLRYAVVDFWGEDKEDASITMRPYDDFVRGAMGWAKAKYPKGTALEQPMSAELAIAWVDYVKQHPVTYNVALCNCEIFATFCRCIRSVHAIECHNALCDSLVLVQVHVNSHRGFK